MRWRKIDTYHIIGIIGIIGIIAFGAGAGTEAEPKPGRRSTAQLALRLLPDDSLILAAADVAPRLAEDGSLWLDPADVDALRAALVAGAGTEASTVALNGGQPYRPRLYAELYRSEPAVPGPYSDGHPVTRAVLELAGADVHLVDGLLAVGPPGKQRVLARRADAGVGLWSYHRSGPQAAWGSGKYGGRWDGVRIWAILPWPHPSPAGIVERRALLIGEYVGSGNIPSTDEERRLIELADRLWFDPEIAAEPLTASRWPTVAEARAEWSAALVAEHAAEE